MGTWVGEDEEERGRGGRERGQLSSRKQRQMDAAASASQM